MLEHAIAKTYEFVVVKFVDVFNGFSVQLGREVAVTTRQRLSGFKRRIRLRTFIVVDGQFVVAGPRIVRALQSRLLFELLRFASTCFRSPFNLR